MMKKMKEGVENLIALLLGLLIALVIIVGLVTILAVIIINGNFSIFINTIITIIFLAVIPRIIIWILESDNDEEV